MEQTTRKQRHVGTDGHQQGSSGEEEEDENGADVDEVLQFGEHRVTSRRDGGKAQGNVDKEGGGVECWEARARICDK